MTTALFAAPSSAHTILAMRHASGHLVFALPGLNSLQAASTRILIDFDGKQTGEPHTGADWMIEQGSIYSFTRQSSGWAWSQIGDAAVSLHKGSAYIVALEKSPSSQGAYLVDSDSSGPLDPGRLAQLKRVDFDLADLPLWPADCVPAPYSLDSWTESLPPSLSVRLKDEVNSTNWEEFPEPWSPVWSLSSTGSPTFPLIIELINPLSGIVDRISGGSLLRSGKTTRWFGQVNDVSWTFLFRNLENGGLDITGHMVSEHERPIQARVGIQVNMQGWQWHDELDAARSITARGMPYAHTAELPLNDIAYSRLPFGVISSNNLALLTENNPSEPRLYRIEADPILNVFGITYDLALTRKTVKFPGQATFQCAFHFNHPDAPSQSMRKMLSDFYYRYPDIYQNRIGHSGTWSPFPNATTIDTTPLDVAFLNVREAGSSIPPDQNSSYLNVLYTEPWYHWLPLPLNEPRDETTAWNKLTLMATSGKSTPHQLAAATISGMARNAKNEPAIQFIHVPWNNGIRSIVSVDPDIPTSEISPVNRAMIEARLIDAHSAEKGWNGIFLDSMGELNTRDFSLNALAASDYPALYDQDAGYPFILSAFPAFDWLRVLHHHVRVHGQFVIGHGAIKSGPWFISNLDGFTDEVNLRDDLRLDKLNGREAQYARILAGAKPYSMGLIADFNKVSPDELETFLQQCIPYGIVPGFHSADGYSQLYWRNTNWIQRDLVLLDKYLPVIQRLSNAGWKPLSNARCINPGVKIEMFGPDSSAVLYTLHNTSASAVNALIELPASNEDEIILYPLSGRTQYRDSGSTDPIECRLGPGEITVFSIFPFSRINSESAHYKTGHIAYFNLSYIRNELQRGLKVTFEYDTPLLRNSDTQIQAIFLNASTNTLTIKDVAARGSATRKKSRDASFSLDPGESYTSFIALTPKDLKGDAPWHISWGCSSGDGNIDLHRLIQPGYADPYSITVKPENVISVESIAAIDVTLVNNGSSFREFDLVTEGETLTGKTSVKIPMEPDSSRTHRILVPGDGAMKQTVELSVKEDKKTLRRQKFDITYLPAGTSLLRDSRVQVLTSGTAVDFQSTALHDGITDLSGLLWNEGSWMSIDRLGSHMVTIKFPQPVIISEVILHWGADAQQAHPPVRGVLRAKMTDGQFAIVSQFTPDESDSITRLTFETIQVSELELIQPPVSGSTLHPLKMWVAEIEVF